MNWTKDFLRKFEEQWRYLRITNKTYLKYRDLKDAVLTSYYRATRGYADKDWYSLNTELAKTLSDRLDALANKGTSTPFSIDQENWLTALRTHAASLHMYYYLDDLNLDKENAAQVVLEAKQAFHWIADNLEDLWD